MSIVKPVSLLTGGGGPPPLSLYSPTNLASGDTAQALLTGAEPICASTAKTVMWWYDFTTVQNVASRYLAVMGYGTSSTNWQWVVRRRTYTAPTPDQIQIYLYDSSGSVALVGWDLPLVEWDLYRTAGWLNFCTVLDLAAGPNPEDKIKFYWQGVPQVVTPLANNAGPAVLQPVTNPRLRQGSYRTDWDSLDQFQHWYAEFQVWNEAKSDAWIAANYNTLRTGNEPNLATYWRGLPDNTISDLTGNLSPAWTYGNGSSSDQMPFAV